MFKKFKNAKEKLTHESEFSDITQSSFRDVIGGEILNTGFARKQVGLIILLVVISFFYIGNRYYCERQLARIDKLQRELVSVKYTYLTISCDLMTMSRQSQVEKSIKDKGIKLKESLTPPYKLEE